MRGRWVSGLVGVMAVGMLAAPGRALAWEQEGHQQPDDIVHRVDRLKTELSLSDEQAQKVRTILESSKTSQEAERAAMQQRREQVDQQIMAVLNDQQKAQYAKLQEARRQHMQDMKEQWQEHHGESRPSGDQPPADQSY